MQLATARRVLNSEKKAIHKADNRSVRGKTIAAIHVVWKKLRPDLHHDAEGLRDARLDFMNDVLKPKRPIESMRDVSDVKLGKVLDRMRELERAPMLPGARTGGGSPGSSYAGEPPAVPGEVVHLATDAQVAAINKLFLHLGWTLESIEAFTFQKFKRKSHRMITPAQANSLTMILLTIASSRDIKRRWQAESGREIGKVSREMIRAEIPQLKRRLGIDQQQSEVRDQRSEAGEEDSYEEDDF